MIFNFFKRKKQEERPNVEEHIANLRNEIFNALQPLQELGEKMRLVEERVRKIEETVVSLKDIVDEHSRELDRIKGDFEKLMSMYEMMANMYNPFVRKPKITNLEETKEKTMKEKTKIIKETKEEYSKYLPLDEIKKDPMFIAVVMAWLQFLVKKAGFENAKRALEYYKEVGWITENVYIELLKYLQGFKNVRPIGTELKPEDHLVSLYFIVKLKKGDIKKYSYEEIYKELVEKGIITPDVGDQIYK